MFIPHIIIPISRHRKGHMCSKITSVFQWHQALPLTFILTLKLRGKLGFISSCTLKAAGYCVRPIRMLSISNQVYTPKYHTGCSAATVNQQPGSKTANRHDSCWPLWERLLCCGQSFHTAKSTAFLTFFFQTLGKA